MADGGGVTIDSLQIEIEASSSNAAEKVNELVSALEKLQKVLSKGFGNIPDQIKNIGKSASSTTAFIEKTGGKSKSQKLQDSISDTREISDIPVSEIDEDGKNRLKEELQDVENSVLDYYKKVNGKTKEKLKDIPVPKQEEINGKKSSTVDLENSILKAKKTYDKFLNSIRKSTSGTALKGLDTEFSKLKKKLDMMKGAKGLTSIKVEGIDKASSDMEKFEGAIKYAKEQADILSDAIDKVKSGTLDIPIDIIRNMEQAYKDAANAARQAGEAAKSSVSSIPKEDSGSDIGGQLKSVMSGIGQISSILKSSDIGGALKKGLNLGSLTSEISTLVGSSKALAGVLGTISSAMPYITAVVTATKIAFELFKNAVQHAQETLNGFVKAVNFFKNAFQSITGVVSSFYKSIYSFLRPAVDAASKSLRKMSDGFKTIGKNAAKAFGTGLKKTITSIGSYFMKPINKLKEFNKWWKNAISFSLTYRAIGVAINFVTKGLKEGLDNLYQYSRIMGTELAPSMNSLATSALYLKNSLGAIAAPLINALAPVVDMLVEKFVALLNIIGKVIAVLTGKNTYTQAKKYATEYAEAAGDAAKATKDFVLGIDELNVINDKASETGTGGYDYSSMFEEVEIDMEDFDWVKQIRDAIKNGEWEEVGKILAEKLNKIIKDWDAEGWGKSLGEKINNGLNIAKGFLKNFEFGSFGEKIADFFNGLFKEIDWDTLGTDFALALNGLFDFIYGFSKKLEWENIGHDIATAVNAFIDEIDPALAAAAINEFFLGLFSLLQTALEEIHWYELGTKLGEFLNGIAWFDLTYNALILIKDAIEAVKLTIDGVLDTWDFMKTASDIAAAINEAFADEAFWKGIGQTIGNAIKASLAFISQLVGEIQWVTIGRDIGQFLIGLDWPGMFDGLADVVAAGINAAIGFVKGLLDVIKPNIEQIGNDISGRIKQFFETDIDWTDLGLTISDGITTALSFVSTLLNPDTFHAIGVAIGEFFVGLNWPELFSGLADVIANGINSAVQLVCGFLDVVQPNIEQIGKDISERIKQFFETDVDWKELANVISRGIQTALSFITGLLQPDTFYEIGKAIAEFFLNLDWPGLFESLGEVLSNAINSAIALIHGFLDTFNPNYKQLAEDIAAKINEFVKGVDWKELGTSIHDGLARAIDFLRTILGNLDWEEIGQAVVDFFTGLDWGDLMSKWDGVIGAAIGGVLKGIDLSDAISLGWNLVEGMISGWMKKWNEEGGFFGFIKKKLFGPLIDAIKNLFGIHSPSTVMRDEVGTNLIAGLLEGLGLGWPDIPKFFEDSWKGITDFLSNTWEGIKSKASESWGAIKNTVGNVWDGVKETASDVWNGVKDTVIGVWDNLKSSASEKFTSIKKNISDAWDNVKETAKNTWENVKTTVIGVWDNLKSGAKEKFDNIKTSISDAWAKVKDKSKTTWDNIKSTVGNVWDNLKTSAKEKFDNIKKNISDAWDNAKKKSSDVWNDVKKTVGDVWDKLKDGAKEKFDLMKKHVSDAWNTIKEKSNDVWKNVKDFVSKTWDDLKTGAKDKFENMKQSISTAWDKAKEASSTTWDNIKTKVGGVWEDLKTGASQKFEDIRKKVEDKWKEVNENSGNSWDDNKSIVTEKIIALKDSIGEKFKSIIDSAVNWGKDICGGIKDGIEDGIKWVKDAAGNAAQKIKDNLHFSEPDEGPLKDFHTYMPDMMKLMAEGIRDNTNLPMNEIEKLTSDMSNSFHNIKTPKDLDFPVHESAYVKYSADYSQMERSRDLSATQDVNERIVADMRDANGDVVNALYTITSQIVNAIEENADNRVVLDGKTLSKSVEKYQRQRGTTIMSGGVL